MSRGLSLGHGSLGHGSGAVPGAWPFGLSEPRGISQGALRRGWSTWVMAQPSRIEIARRRLKVVRYSVGVTAAAAFAVFAFAARAAHPGTSSGDVSTATDSSGAVTSSDDPYGDVESGDSFGF